MNSNHHSITSAIRNLPEREPPYDIGGAVMLNLQPHKDAFRPSLFSFFTDLFSLKTIPVANLAASSLCILLAFVGGYFLHSSTSGQDRVLYAQHPEVNLRIGKEYYAAGMRKEALDFFTRASEQYPDNPVYPLWQGMVYWSLGDFAGERASYQRSIASDPNYLPAILNLANSFLNQGDHQEALPLYKKVLELEPQEKQALYNLALIYRLQEERELEEEALITFLDSYRSGVRAHDALAGLEALGNNEYRTYQIGNRKVILNQRSLLTGQTPILQKEINLVSIAMRSPAPLQLHVVVFSPENVQLGKEKARFIQRALSKTMAKSAGHKVTSSWFAQKDPFVDKHPGNFKESVLLFTTPTTTL